MAVTQSYNFKVKSNIHDYEVEFIDDTKATLESELEEGDFIIIDSSIKRLYESELDEILSKYNHWVLEANERQKSYLGVEPIIEYLIKNGFRKNHRLVAIGGGITQDCTAFMASILYRGVKWVFLPTSLLAQGDSCIGSKTSINFKGFKNLVGGFYPPLKIFINPAFLDTLDQAELKSGLGEMLHYFIVASEEDFRRYKADYDLALTDKEVLTGIIARSLEIKKSYIEIDEYDKKERQVFNYGHTFGHAIESLTDYRVPHGIAVSFGMDISNFVSVKLGLIPDAVRKDVRELVEKIFKGYEQELRQFDVDVYLNAISKDKKNVGRKLGLILNKGFGNIFKSLTDNDEQFRSWMLEYFENEI